MVAQTLLIKILYEYGKTNPVLSILLTETPICMAECARFVITKMYPRTSTKNHQFSKLKKWVFSFKKLQSLDVI